MADANQPKKSGIGSEVYTGVAVYGRFRAVIGAIVGVIIAIIVIIIGYFRLKDPHTATALMSVTSVASCAEHTQPSGKNDTSTYYACVIGVAFTASDGKPYAVPNVNVSVPAPLTPGATIQLRYNPVNPTSVAQEASPRMLGWALIGGGVFLGSAAVGLAVLTFKSKGFAAVEGTAGLLQAIRL